MYQQWPFFKVTLDMVEMVLAKADPRITVLYERELVDPELHEFGAHLRQLFFLTENKLLEVTGHSNLLEGPTGASGAQLCELRQKLNLRTPYITPLNILQAHYLKKQRALEKGNVPAAEWHPKVPFAQELMQLGGGGHSTLHSAVEDIILITIKGACRPRVAAAPPLRIHILAAGRTDANACSPPPVVAAALTGIAAGMQNTG
jgi:phosphoenolpyruvate carboxylase